MNQNDNIKKVMYKNIYIEYTTNIRVKVVINKKNSFKEFIKRDDFEQIKASVEKNANNFDDKNVLDCQ